MKQENIMMNSNVKELNEMRDILVNAVRNVRPNTDGYITNGVLRVVLGLSKGQAAELRREGLINMLKARINQADGELGNAVVEEIKKQNDKRPSDELRKTAINYQSRPIYKVCWAASMIAENPYIKDPETEQNGRLWFKGKNYGMKRVVKTAKLIDLFEGKFGDTSAEQIIEWLKECKFISPACISGVVLLWYVKDRTMKYESFRKQMKARTARILNGTATIEELDKEPWVADVPREFLDSDPVQSEKKQQAPTKEATETVAHAPSNVGDAGAALTNEEPI